MRSNASRIWCGLRRCAVALSIAAGALSCHHDVLAYDVVVGPRDWSTAPAVVVVESQPATLYAVSDVHGGYDRLVTLLAANQVIERVPDAPPSVRWSAGDAVLVVTGDMIDKGPNGLAVLDMLRALAADAPRARGRVIVTLGNHEAEFFADPGNDKADGSDGVDAELKAHGIDPRDLASGKDPRGAWLRTLPLAARVGAWFFAHAADTHGRSIADLERAFRAALDAHPAYDDAEIIGDGSILESRDWYGDAGTATRYAAALSAKHIVMGHDPKALGARGQIAVAENGALLRIDCGMSPDVDDSHGMLLRVRQNASGDVVEGLDEHGGVTPLFQTAP